MTKVEREYSATACLLIEGLETTCALCAAALCLREQVLNLALSQTNRLLCLLCLAKDNDKPAEEVLEELKAYILTRECFAKEWVKYLDQGFCPKQSTCYPAPCFK
jgi:hypothetical protein